MDMMEMWDLNVISVFRSRDEKTGQDIYIGAEELQAALGQGYEPFAVSPTAQMPVSKGILGAPQKPLIGEKVWLRKMNRVPVTPVDNTPKTS